jgi:hypothetical protein
MKTLLLSLAPILALASTSVAQRLVCVDSGRSLWDVDPATGTRTQFGTVSSNAGTCGGLAYDVSTGTMYLTSTSLDSLYTLDLATGTATLVGAYGNSALVMHGLEWDSSTGTLYGVSSHDNGLYTISTTTGVATLIGTSGLASFSNLVYDSISNVMYSTNSGADSFYLMDRTTGSTTLIGALLGPTNPNALAFDSATNTVYLICNNTDTLYTVDRTTGAATSIGAIGSSNVLGLAYIPAGGGSIARVVHGCGPTTITPAGLPNLGGSVTTTLGGTTGVPFVGYGLAILSVPFCTCTLGHEWSVANFGATSTMNIPADPVFTGISIGVQGADLLGVGGCPAPQVTLTDTLVLTIG